MSKPLTLTAPEVRALRAGETVEVRKEIRRLTGFGKVTEFGPSDTRGYDWHFRDSRMRWNEVRHARLLRAGPWQPGETYWVRETWRQGHPMINGPDKDSDVAYRADYIDSPLLYDRKIWKASVVMPRWASRLSVTATSVRVVEDRGKHFWVGEFERAKT